MRDTERLVAIEEIKQLKARYLRTLDAKDWTAFGAVFTSDAVMDMRSELTHHGDDASGALLAGKDPVLVGRDVIAAFVSAALPPTTISVHHGHMPEITILDGGAATGIWALFDYLDWGGSGLRGYGHYHEEYRCVDGGWLISRLELRRVRVDRF